MSAVRLQRYLLNALSENLLTLCFVAYAVGCMWFVSFANHDGSKRTYLSENALLPGNAVNEFGRIPEDAQLLGNIYNQLQTASGNTSLDLALVVESHLHNWRIEVQRQAFTVQNPHGHHAKISGTNVYAVLRAHRSDGSEALVLTAPLMSKEYPGVANTMGISVVLSLVHSMQRSSYWAKDIIVVFPDHGELGMHLWIKSYLGIAQSSGTRVEPLLFYSGVMQAGLNLDFGNAAGFASLGIYPEGTNGQMPNLDLINTVVAICRYQHVPVQLYNHLFTTPFLQQHTEFIQSFKTMLFMMKNQALGHPTGAHGVFHRYRVDMITLSAFQGPNGNWVHPQNLATVTEGTLRSLNNLLEHLHQSFFFYIMPSRSAYISIGMYSPPLGMIAGGLLLLAIAIWYETSDWKRSPDGDEPLSKTDSQAPRQYARGPLGFSRANRPLLQPLGVLALSFLTGALLYELPTIRKSLGVSTVFVHMKMLARDLGISLQVGQYLDGSWDIYWTTLIALLSSQLGARIYRHTAKRNADCSLILQAYLGVIASATLLVVAIINFSLAFYIALTLAPLVLMTRLQFSALVKVGFVLLASPAAYFMFVAVWEQSKNLELMLDKSIQAWKPLQWIDGITLKNGDYLDYGRNVLEAVALGLGEFVIVLWQSLVALVTEKDWILAAGRRAHEVYLSHWMVDSWLYSFTTMVWWPLIISLWTLIIAV